VSRRPYLTLLIALIVPAGLASKFYAGPAEFWVNNSLGGVLYLVFWCLLAGLANARWRPGAIAATVLAITATLEVLQLWHPPLLEWIRSHFIGRALIGTQLVWSDFAYYLVGAVIGYYLLLRFSRSGEPARPAAARSG